MTVTIVPPPSQPETEALPQERVPTFAEGRELKLWARFGKATARVLTLMGADVLFLGAVFFLLHEGDGLPLPAQHEAFPVAVILAALVAGSYRMGRNRRDPGKIVLTATLATILVLYHVLWISGPAEALQWALPLWLPALVAIAGSRFTVDRLLRVWRPEMATTRALLILGEHPVWVPEDEPGPETAHLRVVDRIELQKAEGGDDLTVQEISGRMHAVGADAILVSGLLSEMDYSTVIDASLSTGGRLLATPRTPAIPRMAPYLIWIDEKPLMELVPPGLAFSQLAAKRFLDLTAGLVLLVLLSPLMAAIALWIRISSGSAPLFRHVRLGKDGRRFQCIKFQTMHPGADALLRQEPELYRVYVENDFKLHPDQDPRVTRVGRLLRKTSLDELPQLFNVLKGEMSLVGPRPIVPDEIAHFPHQEQLLLSVKPGMTGLWATRGRSNIGYPDRALMELEYVRNWSVLEDLRILLLTFPAVVRARGAF